MKRLLSVVLFIVFLPLLGMAQSDFDGTWKVDLTKSTMPEKHDVFLLQNGTYKCKTCVPPINVKADGEDHGVPGSPYYDTVALKVLDDHSVETIEKKNGNVVQLRNWSFQRTGTRPHLSPRTIARTLPSQSPEKES